jgi:hypothetical protein
VRIVRHGRTWKVDDVKGLQEVLTSRDSPGGGDFWLSHDDEEYPCLAIRLSGNVADVHFFPGDCQAVFRCLGGDGMPDDGSTLFVFEGCDPGYGEETPNDFVIPVGTAVSIAKEFFLRKRMSDAVSCGDALCPSATGSSDSSVCE